MYVYICVCVYVCVCVCVYVCVRPSSSTAMEGETDNRKHTQLGPAN